MELIFFLKALANIFFAGILIIAIGLSGAFTLMSYLLKSLGLYYRVKLAKEKPVNS
ncbi:hypothetical protein DYBT9275_01424 [Dyadobacter sp. CECT 9275]|uniref:Uncharacterized protein n=1 Tax=Dyadobacter helix TaxID=2822344 RepID=A0A916NKG1_9BACT|nr:hypothetical protein [Dyadobacter sp. CECT 9275]CAG4994586.1 hypothetical protein DYBT9275_01424 [Dyadobacter sp. CECT 9275]